MNDAEKTAKKNKRDIIITSILLVIFAISFTKNILLNKKEVAPADTQTGAGQSISEQLVLATNIRLYDKLRKERMQLWDREWGRDPFTFQETVTSVVKAVNLTLKGILWDEKNPKAIINDKTLVKGDTIYGYSVEEIRPRSVILKTGEKNIELQIFRRFSSEMVASGS